MVRNLGLIAAATVFALWAGTAVRAARPDSDAQTAWSAGHGARGEGGRTPPFHGLLAADEMEVRSRLGAPDVARAEGAGAMWTYRLPDCALFVFFKSPQGQPLKVSGAASGPRVRGRTPPPVNECVAEALDRQDAVGRSNP